MNNLKVNIRTKKLLWLLYYNNKSTTSCFCGCGRIIPADNIILFNLFNTNFNNLFYDDYLEYGNLVSNNFSNEEDNIRPICRTCYNEMGKLNLIDYCNYKGYLNRDCSEVVPMDICNEYQYDMDIENN